MSESSARREFEPAFTVWFTGLPCSGKTTLANLLADELSSRSIRSQVLDGDSIRRTVCRDLGFSREDRVENIRRIMFIADLLTRNGVVAIIAVISPYRSGRTEARALIGRFVEVYVKASLEVLKARDVKGMYQKAMTGQIMNFTGISDPYEEPEAPEVLVDTEEQSPEESLGRLVAALKKLNLLRGTDKEKLIG